MGIFVGVTIGAVAANYIIHALFGGSRSQEYPQGNYAVGQSQFNQAPIQQGVFEQALSAPNSNAQNRVY